LITSSHYPFCTVRKPDKAVLMADGATAPRKIGGSPGHYALWLAPLNYEVVHRDRMRLRVEQLRRPSLRT
jgi:hypothetical protein